jgi:hypothetical protein
MITIPTTELIGGLADVLPIISNPKAELAGVGIAWDGEALHFTTYDVNSGATVRWIPGEGAEGKWEEGEDPEEDFQDIVWGGDDAPWSTWIRIEQAKEILKLFKLPAKLWRFPVTLKCSLSGDRLTVERTDSPKGERLLSIPGDPAMLAKVPDVRAVTDRAYERTAACEDIGFAAYRIGAFGTVRPHGTLHMAFGAGNTPVGITVGSRFAGFVYSARAQNVRPYSFLRDAAGVVVSREPAGPSEEADQDD